MPPARLALGGCPVPTEAVVRHPPGCAAGAWGMQGSGEELSALPTATETHYPAPSFLAGFIELEAIWMRLWEMKRENFRGMI